MITWPEKPLCRGEAPRFAMAELLEKHAHIKFEIAEGKLKYSAPWRGYQA